MTDSRVHFDKIADQTYSSSYHTANTGFEQNWVPIVTKGGKLLMSQNQLVNRVAQETIYKINPQTGINPNALSPQQIRFQLTNGGYSGVYKHLALKLTITNGSVGAVAFGDLIQAIERFQVITASGEIIEEKYTEELYLDTALNLKDEDFGSLSSLIGLDASHNTSTATLAASASQTYYIPIWSFINTVKPAMSLLKEPVYIEFFMRGLTAVSGSLTAATVSDVSLLVMADRLGENEMKHIDKEYSRKIYSRYTYWQRQGTDITLTANTSYDIRLQSLNALSSFFVVGAQPLAITASNRYSFAALESLNLKDHTGVTYDIEREAAFIRNYIAHKHFDSSVFDTKNLYPWAYASDCTLVNDIALNMGFKKFDSASPDVLTIRTPTGLSGNHRINVWAKCYGLICINNGKLSSVKSG